jgi:HEAT repeat protein
MSWRTRRPRHYGSPPPAPASPESDEARLARAIEQNRWEDVAGFGATAIPALCRYLNDEGPLATDYDREKAMGILGALAAAGERAACEALLALPAGRGELANVGEPVVEGLLDVVADADDSLRVPAIGALGDIGSVRAAGALYEVWKNETSSRSQLQFAAETALRRCGWTSLPDDERRSLTDELVSPLAAILADPDRQTDWRLAAITLAETRDGAAIAAVVAFLAAEKGQRRFRDWEDATQFAEQRLDVSLSRSDVSEVLCRLVAHPNPLLRATAMRLLGRVSGPGILEAVRPALRDPVRGIREQAAAMLEARGWEPSEEELPWWLVTRRMWHAAAARRDALDALLAAARDSALRSDACAAIAGIADSSAAEALVRLLGDQDRELRLAAARALGVMGDARGRDVLAAAFRDRSADRNPIARALARCGAAGGMRDVLTALLERGTPLISSADPTGVSAFLRDAAAHLPQSEICVARSSSSSSDEHPTHWEKTYDETGFLLEGRAAGADAEKLATRRTGEAGLDSAHFSGRGDEAVWLLESGDLLRVTTTSYSMHAARSSSHLDWTGEAERLDATVLAPDPTRARAAVVACIQPLLERRIELDTALSGAKEA